MVVLGLLLWPPPIRLNKKFGRISSRVCYNQNELQMQKIPKIVGSRSIHKSSFVEVKIDVLELNGHRWEQVYFIKPNKNGVGILPIDETGIYLVNQYRHASQSFLWQIPMGMINKGSYELETAQEELAEETGLMAEEFIKIGSLIAEPGMSNQEEFIYVAKGLKHSRQNLGITELGMQVKHFSFDEIERMVQNGEIKCGFTLSALYLFNNNFLKSK